MRGVSLARIATMELYHEFGAPARVFTLLRQRQRNEKTLRDGGQLRSTAAAARPG